MPAKIEKAISYCFYALFFLVPLVLHPKTSELFEFNKMVLTYALTVVIVALWLTRSLLVKKFVFKRTLLDIPLLIFLATQFLSTITSIDFRISLLGYYSRYHGGFASSVSYALLYWAYVSNLGKRETKNVIRILLTSAALVSIYGVLEHFGIDKNIWIQDVQTRVFSTLGQPNWLAAWLVALIPITWALAINSKHEARSTKHKIGHPADYTRSNSHSALDSGSWFSWIPKQVRNDKGVFAFWFFLSSLFFLTLIYTKSRSGFMGFAAAWIIFWPMVFGVKLKLKQINKSLVLKSIILNSSFIILVLTSGTQWTPSVGQYLARSNASQNNQAQVQERPEEAVQEELGEVKFQAPALVLGGSASTEIRKIVWTGALDIWKNYPILGTGVETFALSYYNFRPVEHNLVSEWDFLYNKAHNEYLNIMATTGTLGILGYLALIAAIAFMVTREFRIRNPELSRKDHNSNFLLHASLFAGFVSILVTNFFGFSVVPVGLQFFLYPAMAVALGQEGRRLGEASGSESEKARRQEDERISPQQWAGIAFISLAAFYLLLATGRYWYADLQYSLGKAHNDVGNYNRGREYLVRATGLSPKESVFWEELSDVNTNAALALGQTENVDQKLLANVVRSAINESKIAADLSPKNVNTKRKQASMYIKLSVYDPQLLIEGQRVLKDALKLAPTEAKLWYNYALTFMRIGQIDKAKEILEKTIEMKPNYKNARLAYGLVLSDLGEKERAIEELEYILKYVAPGDKLTIQQLEEIRGN